MADSAAAFAKLSRFMPQILAELVSPPPPPLLRTVNNPHSLHPIIRTLQKLELGKLVLTLAAIVALELLLSQKFDSAVAAHQLIIAGLMAAFAITWNGTLFGTIFPRIGSNLEFLGISIVLLFLFDLVATFLSVGFSIAYWLLSALCLVSFVYVLIKPHVAAA